MTEETATTIESPTKDTVTKTVATEEGTTKSPVPDAKPETTEEKESEESPEEKSIDKSEEKAEEKVEEKTEEASAPEEEKKEETSANGSSKETPIEEKSATNGEKKDEEETAPTDASEETKAEPNEEEKVEPKANGTEKSADETKEEEEEEDADAEDKSKESKSSVKKRKSVRKTESSLGSEEPLEVGTVVLAKVKGYPSWPGIIVSDDLVPEEVLAVKPKSAASRRKSSASNTELDLSVYPVRFFIETSYTWATRADIQLLTPEDAKASLKKNKKAKRLTEAYEVAVNPPSLKDIEKQIKELTAAEDVEMEDASEEEVEKPARKRRTAAPKKAAAPRKSTRSKKDIFDPDSDSPETKPKRVTRKTSSESNDSAATGSKRKSTATTTTSRKRARSSSEKDDSATSTPAPSSNLDTYIVERTSAIRAVRHRLQRTFIGTGPDLGRDQASMLSLMLNKLESIPNLEYSIIRETKIKKVLSSIYKRLKEIDDIEKFNIEPRISTLIKTWTRSEADDGSRVSTANSDSK